LSYIANHGRGGEVVSLSNREVSLLFKKKRVKLMYEETQTHILVDNSIPLDGYYFNSFKWLTKGLFTSTIK
jgi:hypothetical protein